MQAHACRAAYGTALAGAQNTKLQVLSVKASARLPLFAASPLVAINEKLLLPKEQLGHPQVGYAYGQDTDLEGIGQKRVGFAKNRLFAACCAAG